MIRMFLHARRFDSTRDRLPDGMRERPATATAVDLAAAGYTEREFFLSGTARSFREDGRWDSDGHWSVSEAGQAPYRTRLLVRAPEDPSGFDGTVVVEWLDVSSGADADAEFEYVHPELLRGYVWVGVSAQAVGVNNTGGTGTATDAVGLKAWDPLRYGPLHHPGDAYSYDIFSQAGVALRTPGGARPLAGLEVERLLAVGHSQAAMRLLTYVNAVHPAARVFDGFLLHGRPGFGAPLGAGTGLPGVDGPDGPFVVEPARVRTDLTAPVFQLVDEADLLGRPGAQRQSFVAARQPDTDRVRTWEVTGGSPAKAGVVGAHAPVAAAALRALDSWAGGHAAPARFDTVRA